MFYRRHSHTYIRSKTWQIVHYGVILAIFTFVPFFVYGRTHPPRPERGPIRLYSFDSAKGAVLGNGSDHAVVVESIDVTVNSPRGQQSLGWQIGRTIKAHGTVPLPFREHAAQYATLKEYASSHWGEAWIAANDAYGKCLAIDVLSPDEGKLRAIRTTYQGKPLPIGNATAVITYLASEGTESERFPLSALLLRKIGCTP